MEAAFEDSIRDAFQTMREQGWAQYMIIYQKHSGEYIARAHNSLRYASLEVAGGNMIGYFRRIDSGGGKFGLTPFIPWTIKDDPALKEALGREVAVALSATDA